jgi:hypothetical protein
MSAAALPGALDNIFFNAAPIVDFPCSFRLLRAANTLWFRSVREDYTCALSGRPATPSFGLTLTSLYDQQTGEYGQQRNELRHSSTHDAVRPL